MSQARNDVLISAFLILLLVGVVWEARDWPFRTRLFPWAIGFPMLALALVQCGCAVSKALRRQSGGKADIGTSGQQAPLEVSPAEQAGLIADPAARARAIAISAWTVAFALGFWLFGFKIGGLLLSLTFLRFQARESWKTSVVFALGIYLFFLLGFELALGVPLAPGVIATALELQSFDWYLVNPLLNVILRR